MIHGGRRPHLFRLSEFSLPGFTGRLETAGGRRGIPPATPTGAITRKDRTPGADAKRRTLPRWRRRAESEQFDSGIGADADFRQSPVNLIQSLKIVREDPSIGRDDSPSHADTLAVPLLDLCPAGSGFEFQQLLAASTISRRDSMHDFTDSITPSTTRRCASRISRCSSIAGFYTAGRTVEIHRPGPQRANRAGTKAHYGPQALTPGFLETALSGVF